MSVFERYKHPVVAVPCPDCKARVGAMCKRPSGHAAADFHTARKTLADEAFIAEHGPDAGIERTPIGWKVNPTGYADYLKSRGRKRQNA